MRPALAALLFVALLAAIPLAQSGGTLYDRHEEVNVARPFRHLATTQVGVPSDIFLEIQCWERAMARVVVISSTAEVALAECSPFSRGTSMLQASPGPVRILVMGEGLPTEGEIAVFQPGYFNVLVYAEDR